MARAWAAAPPPAPPAAAAGGWLPLACRDCPNAHGIEFVTGTRDARPGAGPHGIWTNTAVLCGTCAGAWKADLLGRGPGPEGACFEAPHCLLCGAGAGARGRWTWARTERLRAVRGAPRGAAWAVRCLDCIRADQLPRAPGGLGAATLGPPPGGGRPPSPAPAAPGAAPPEQRKTKGIRNRRLR
jgi:hypothetical protein